jgi:hypothetical protein
VSLRERLGRGHLSERQLASVWTSGGSHPHLDACEACRARFRRFDLWITGLGDELRTEADAAFFPEQLVVQQAQITRRIEAMERPGRIIAFPKAARAVISGHSHVRRWVTVAAAASLIAGFSLGQVVPLKTIRRPHQIAAAPAARPAPASRAVALPSTIEAAPPLSDEEMFSSDAFSRSHVSTLSALDDMTPHARDTILNRRNK